MEMNNNDKFSNEDLDNIINHYRKRPPGNSFDDFWEEVKAFAEQNRLSTEYVEDEFILDGELLPVHLQWQDELNEELWNARVEEHDRLAQDEQDFLGDPPDDLTRIIDEILAREAEEWDDPLT